MSIYQHTISARMRFACRVLGSVLVSLWLVESTSADIVQSNILGGKAIWEEFGQSFTATASEPFIGTVSFNYYRGFNPHLPDPVMTAHLFSGVGVLGTHLASSNSFAIPTTTPAESWIDFSFPSNVPLVSGNVYSLFFTYVGPGMKSGLHSFDFTNPYAGGTFLNASGSPVPGEDLTFRVLTAVPEGRAWLFLGIVTIGAWLVKLMCSRRAIA